MRTLITGARSITDKDTLYAHLDQLLQIQDGAPQVSVILSGGQKGVDSLVEEYARDNDIPFVLFKPYHLLDSKAEHNPRHYFVRNKQMVDNADWVIVFSDGQDTGTEDVVEYARKRHKAITLIEPEQFNKVNTNG